MTVSYAQSNLHGNKALHIVVVTPGLANSSDVAVTVRGENIVIRYNIPKSSVECKEHEKDVMVKREVGEVEIQIKRTPEFTPDTTHIDKTISNGLTYIIVHHISEHRDQKREEKEPKEEKDPKEEKKEKDEAIVKNVPPEAISFSWQSTLAFILITFIGTALFMDKKQKSETTQTKEQTKNNAEAKNEKSETKEQAKNQKKIVQPTRGDKDSEGKQIEVAAEDVKDGNINPYNLRDRKKKLHVEK